MNLNQHQQAAAGAAHEAPLKIIAGAGTGKTETLAARYVELVRRGVPPERIVLTTFTEDAAAEMRARVALRLRESGLAVAPWALLDLPISTFHGFAMRLLREFGFEAGLPPAPRLLGDDDVALFWDELRAAVEARSVLPNGYTPLEHNAYQWDSGETWNRARSILEALRRGGGTPAELEPHPQLREHQLHEFAAQREQLVPLVEHCYAAWVEHLHTRGALDYDELLLAALRLLRDNPGIARRFDVLMVDEFQDTNRPQLELLEAAQTAFRRTTVVGDPRQAIYGWNSARAELIRSFPFGPPGAEHPLTVNYRSHPAIIALANLALSGSELAGEAPLEAVSGAAVERPGTIEPQAASLHLFGNVEDEARFVAANIVRLHRAGVRYSDMAVLLRSRTRLPELLAALRDAGVPTIAAGGAGLYLDGRVRLLSSLLRLIADPLDQAAATNVLESPLAGLPPGVLGARLEPDSRPNPAALLRDPQLLPGAWPARNLAVQRLARLGELLRQARLRWDLLSPGEYVEWLWRAGGVPEAAWPDEPANAGLVLRRIQRDADGWNETHPGGGMAGWAALLEHNIREQPRVALPAPPAPDAVLVATVHQAKGREWPVVFVYNTQLPSRRAGSIDGVLWDERWKLVISNSARGDETLAALRADLRRRQRNEERSIWYVAITRARERLFVLHSGCAYDDGFADAAAKLARAAAGEPPAAEDEAIHFFHEMWERLRADADGLGAVIPCGAV